MTFLRILCAPILAFALISCASGDGFLSKPVDMTAAAKSAYVAKSTYQGYLTLAVAYNERPRCGRPTSPPLCSDQAAVNQLRKASDAANAATQAAEDAVRTMKDKPTIVQAAVVAAEQSVVAMNTIVTVYNLK